MIASGCHELSAASKTCGSQISRQLEVPDFGLKHVNMALRRSAIPSKYTVVSFYQQRYRSACHAASPESPELSEAHRTLLSYSNLGVSYSNGFRASLK